MKKTRLNKSASITPLLSATVLAFLVSVGMPANAKGQHELSRAAYDKLSAARNLMDQKQYNQAARKLQALAGEVDGQDYDQAVVLQTLGYAYLDDGDQASAIDAFARAVALNALPGEPQGQVQYALGQLYAANGQYAKARDVLVNWAGKARPAADDYVLLATVHAQLNEYADGIEAIRKAIRAQSKPERQHYELLIAMLFQSERYTEGASVLEDMVERWPEEKQYWTQLSNIYLNQNKKIKAHTTLALAYRKGLLRTQSELLNLAQLGMAAGLPDHAARVIAEGMDNRKIVSTEEHWKLLAMAWAQAREVENAVAAYNKAAEFGNAGEYHLRQAELHMQNNDWQKVLSATDQALSRGGLKSPGRAHLLRGMAHIQREEYPQSLDALNQARNYRETSGPASQWAEYVQRRQQVSS